MVLLQTVCHQDSLMILIEFLRMAAVAGLLVFIQHHLLLTVQLPAPVYPHITRASRPTSVLDHFHRGFVRLGNRVFQQPFFQAAIHRGQVFFAAPDDPSGHDLTGDIHAIPAESLLDSVQRQRVYIFRVHDRRPQRWRQDAVPQKILWTVPS